MVIPQMIASNDPLIDPSHLARNPVHNPMSRHPTVRHSSIAHSPCDCSVVAIDVVSGSLVQCSDRRGKLEQEGVEEDDY